MFGTMWAILESFLPGLCPCGHRARGLCAVCAARAHAAPLQVPPPGVASWAAPFAYAGPVRELVARSKYRGARAGLPWLADAMVAAHRSRGLPVPHVVTWPPTTAARRRARGFDQAEVLARAVARRLGVRAAPLLTRLDDRSQTGADRRDRLAGPRMVARRPVAGAGVLLVDDVATTGATLAAAAAALRRAGAVHVDALTAARTPSPHGVQARPSRRE
jgi:predicted amidophosphoribosyltransferase